MQIISKKFSKNITGGCINNYDLDIAIQDDIKSSNYYLSIYDEKYTEHFNNLNNGTVLVFQDLNNEIFNTFEYIKKLVVLYFNFAIYDNKFNIYFNDELLDEKQLEDLSSNTQFLWILNSYTDPYISTLNNLEYEIKNFNLVNKNIRGYISTVKKPSNLKIRGSNEKVTVDLFVNGRLREKDILKHIPSSRLVENYMYGRIYVDSFDTGNSIDIFTSNRESIKSDSPEFFSFLKEIQSVINSIINDWDVFRRKVNDFGDSENTVISIKERKAEELFISSLNEDFINKKVLKESKLLSGWIDSIKEEAIFNIPSYSDCFLSENLLRKYIEYKKISLTKEARNEILKFKNNTKTAINKANISFDIRNKNDELSYLSMDGLACLIDKQPDKIAGLNHSAIEYKPIRDALCHTSMLTFNAKSRLSLVYENIKARIVELLNVL